MEKLKLDLWRTLQELTADQFNSFKWFLNERGIPKARLEKATWQDTVDLMVQRYQGPGALRQTLEVLAIISRNDLVQHLQESSSALTAVNDADAAPLRSDFERMKADVGAKLALMIQERKEKVREIQRSAELSGRSADRHIVDSERAFNVLLRAVKRSLSDLIDAINEERRTTQKQASAFTKELEQEISELANTREKMEQLSYTEDHLHLLKSFSPVTPSTNWTEVGIRPTSYGGTVGTAMKQLVAQVSAEKDKLIGKAKLNRVQEFARDVTLDPETANPYLVLSDDGKQVCYCGNPQKLPDTPGRFNTAINVLGKQSVSSGRFYFEVQVEGKSSWDLGVVKESVQRKGSINTTAANGYWTVFLRNGGEYKSSAGSLRPKRPPNKVGVFVEYDKGSVTFYDVESTNVIHTFTDCRFSERLHPFFSPGKNAGPLVITPVTFTD